MEMQQSAEDGLWLAVRLGEEATLVDITPEGEEILEQPLSLSARLAQQAQLLNWTKIRSKPLDTGEDESADDKPQIPPLQTAKESIHKAWQEISITLDVVNRMLAAEKRNSKDPDMSNLRLLPAPRRPPPSQRHQIESIELTMAAKLQHLKSISDRFSEVAERLNVSAEGDQTFYGTLTTNLQEKDWILQAKTFDGFGKTLYVDYTYAHAGSDFREVGHGDVRRNIVSNSEKRKRSAPEDDGDVDLMLYHRKAKRLRILVGQSEASSAQTKQKHPDVWKAWELDNVPPEEGLYKKLALAQATIFDLEMFHKIAEELSPGQSSASEARILDKAIAVSLHQSSAKMIIDMEEAPLTLAAKQQKSTFEISTSELLYEYRDNALMELLAHQALRRIHRSRISAARQGVTGMDTPKRRTPQPKVFQQISLSVDLHHLRASIQSDVDGAVRCLRGGFDLKVRRRRGSEPDVDATWTLGISNLWEVTIMLDASGQITGRATLRHKSRLSADEVAEYIRDEIWRICLEIVKREIDMTSDPSMGKPEWVTDGLKLRALVHSAAIPIRYFFIPSDPCELCFFPKPSE
ncbi:subunit 17 of mediator complex-domain-containing protein [Powellomyces hirtus]|nr:subunit 17 of mediator complex-domain-containing protein [Powellomyces hirtus]